MKSHSTSSYIGTHVRLLAALVLSALSSMYIPYFGTFEFDDYLSFNSVNTGILYAIVIGFLMMIAMNRRNQFDEHISLELNKLRRIYHLAKHIKETSPEAAAWFKKVDKALTDYHRAFEKRDFFNYEEGNILNRKITYAVYQLPKVAPTYNPELYNSLLEATASLTEARERINSIKDASIGYFQWFSTATITLLFGFIVVAASPYELFPRLVTGAVLFNLFLMVQLIYEYDRANPKKRKYYAALYLENEKLMKKGA